MTKNAIGTPRQTLQLNGQQFQVDQVEQDALVVFLTSLRRTRYWKHEPWCDPKLHAEDAQGAELDESPCVGRPIQVSNELGGWWHQADVGAAPLFYVDRDRRSGPSWDATPEDLRAAVSFLPDDAPARGLFTRALADLEQGPAGGDRS